MEKTSVLIVENDPLQAKDLSLKLVRRGFNVLTIISTGEEAIAQLQENYKPDLLLLDIQLDGEIDGISVAQFANKQELNVPIVFLTRLQDQDTFKRALVELPSSFLVKPINEASLSLNLELALYRASGGKEKQVPQTKNEGYLIKDSLFIKEQHRYSKIPITEILYLEAEGSYTCFHLKDRQLILSENLNNYVKRIDFNNLIRIHRSYMINIDHITAFDEGRVWIENVEIPIGKTYRKDWKKRFIYL